VTWQQSAVEVGARGCVDIADGIQNVRWGGAEGHGSRAARSDLATMRFEVGVTLQ